MHHKHQASCSSVKLLADDHLQRREWTLVCIPSAITSFAACPMATCTLFLVNSIPAIGHGLGFIFLPSLLLALYQVPVAPVAVLMGQLFGVQLLFVAIITWYARDLRQPAALNAIIV